MDKKNSNQQGERKKKTYAPVGVIIEDREKREDGQPKFYIKLSKDTQISINGKDVSGGYLQVSYPTDKFDNMLKRGSLTQEEYLSKVARFSEGGDLSYIAFEVNAAFEE